MSANMNLSVNTLGTVHRNNQSTEIICCTHWCCSYMIAGIVVVYLWCQLITASIWNWIISALTKLTHSLQCVIMLVMSLGLQENHSHKSAKSQQLLEKSGKITVKSRHSIFTVIYFLQSHYLAAPWMPVSRSSIKQVVPRPLYSYGIKMTWK